MRPMIIGLVLAGGEGRRMNYQNKGLVNLQGKMLIEHVLKRLSPQVDKIYISANDDLPSYRALGYDVVTDEAQWQGKGPLAGIATLLRQLPEDAVVQVVSCDGPLIPEDLVEKLAKARKDPDNPVRIVYPKTGTREHYLYLQGQVSDLQQVYDCLERDDLRIRALLSALSAHAVLFADEHVFVNCNSPQDIVRLEEDSYEKL